MAVNFVAVSVSASAEPANGLVIQVGGPTVPSLNSFQGRGYSNCLNPEFRAHSNDGTPILT